MGILNVTPDSFYSASRMREESILKTAEQMLSDGANFLDIGGYSSRPGADEVSEQEELDRVIPAISTIIKSFSEAIISIDTFRSTVAAAALEAGAKMINDISGGELDTEMIPLAARSRTPYIGMHMKGTPSTMQSMTEYGDIVSEVLRRLNEIKASCDSAGVHDLIIDPGFGFAKTLEQNYYLLKNLSRLKILDSPILVGLSRKSMIYKLLETDPEEALTGTIGLNTVALLNGADILRVHDVKEAVELTKVIKQLNDSSF